MTTIAEATAEDVAELVALEGRLFVEDAGVYDTHVDLTWPEREGARDFTRLIEDASSVVFVARNDGSAIGLLVGYVTPPSPTRMPVDFAVLRSMYVVPGHRSAGVGGLMANRFLDWARDMGCVEAHVASYAANERAQGFYERLGFAARSVSRVRAL